MFDPDLFDDHIDLTPDTDINTATTPLPAGPGICLFLDANQHPMLLLPARNLRTVIRRRLTQPDPDESPTRRADLKPVTAALWFTRTFSPFATQLTFFRTARIIFPDTWPELFPRLNAWFLQWRRTADPPLFRITSEPHPDHGPAWGPLPTQTDARAVLDLLLDIFDLCRCVHTRPEKPDPPSCPYVQMHRCAAVTDQLFDTSRHHASLQRAADFLNAPLYQNRLDLRRQMSEHAAAQRYEQARLCKQHLDRLDRFDKPTFRWFTRLDRFLVLSLQPGPRYKPPGSRAAQPTIAPFFITADTVRPVEPFPFDQTAANTPALLDHLSLLRFQQSQTSQPPPDPPLLAWLTHTLNHPSRDKGIFLIPDEQLTAEQLTRTITDHFTASETTPSAGTKAKPRLDTASLRDQTDPDTQADSESP